MFRRTWSARNGERSLARVVLPFALGAALCSPTILNAGEIAPPAAASASTGHLLFDEEFDGPAGSMPDPKVWIRQTSGGWGSGELSRYTNDPANAHLDGSGHLVITAMRDRSDAVQPFTSARLASRDTVGPYFRAEARIKVPTGYGVWPVFWLLGGPVSRADTVWPRKGEIDVMEVIGKLPTTTFATPHGYTSDPTTRPAPNAWYDDTQYDTHEDLSAGFHTWAVEERRDQITWWFDGHIIKTFTKSQLKPGAAWSFGYPMHIILNLGVGGFFADSPRPTTPFPEHMVVDYVRVTELQQ